MSDKASNKKNIIKKAKIRAMDKIMSALMEEEFLTVLDASEVLLACNNAVKSRTINAMNAEEAKPLSEALSHLKKSKILKPGANDIKHINGMHIGTPAR